MSTVPSKQPLTFCDDVDDDDEDVTDDVNYIGTFKRVSFLQPKIIVPKILVTRKRAVDGDDDDDSSPNQNGDNAHGGGIEPSALYALEQAIVNQQFQQLPLAEKQAIVMAKVAQSGCNRFSDLHIACKY